MEMKNLITCLTVTLVSGATFADTLTVDDDGKADFDNIQAAVDAASNGDEIIVAPGTYTGSGDEVVNMLGKEIWLHSSEGAGVTIIDGEDARRGVLCNSGETSNTIIEGFTITNGYADNGGGMCNKNNSSPTLTDCTFENNYADRGGGMFNDSSNPTLENCTFMGNTATNNGGGMYNTYSDPTLTNCTFENNTAWAGGGMYNDYGGNPTLTGCTFTDNTASNGGGMSNENCCSPTLTNCTFTNNSATNHGGGMYNWCGNPTLTDTVVCGNTPDQIYNTWTDNGGNLVADECPDADDADGDGIPDDIDNCYLYNPDQIDCNGNEVGDVCDIADGTSNDWDGNGIPDDCECLADIALDDGQVNVNDLLTLIAVWDTASPIGDINYDGIVDIEDLLILIAAWGACP
jgi:parallel beta-helix repeat protein